MKAPVANTTTGTESDVVVDVIAPPSIEERRKTASSDLTSLNRVSHKLALVDNSLKLQTVLDKLLPRLLQRIGDNNQAQLNTDDPQLKSFCKKTHLKLVEMLSHIMKRVRDDKYCRLTNAQGILDLLLTTDENSSNNNTVGNDENESTTKEMPGISMTAKDCDSFSLNLSLAFLTLAIPRCKLSELENLLPGLLVLHVCYERRVRTIDLAPSFTVELAKKQWHQVSHLLLRTLERIVTEKESSLNHATTTENITATKRIPAMDNSKSNNKNKRIKTNNNEKNNVSNDDNDNKESGKESSSSISGLELARILLSQQQDSERNTGRITIADAMYGLLLDVLLYRTQVGNVPPAGMGSANWERLKSGHSITEHDWATEMALSGRLVTFKNRILQWIAPNRRWCLFLGNNDDSDDNHDDNNNNKVNNSSSHLLLGRSRMVALLVIASGDSSKDVSESAKQYLKQYFDSQRETGGFGNSTVLSKELLCLCVGGINASLVLSSSASSSASAPAYVSTTATAATCNNNIDNSRYHGTFSLLPGDLSFRRRQVSDSNFIELIGTATQALNEADDEDIHSIGKLALLASDKKLGNVLGMSLLRGRPYIVAAELLNGLIVRLEKNGDQDDARIFNLDARVLTLAVKALTPTATSQVSSSSSSQMSDTSIAVRESIYGTISILCRSRFARKEFLCLMAAGNTETTVLSTDLLQLLFRCVGNEVDTLRTRATAALDALLSACRRVVERRDELKKEQEQISATLNPWENFSNSRTKNPPSAEISSIVITNQLSRSLLPILWTASNISQPRQSRTATARWSSDLLIYLDVINATHILSFLAGDSDVTASAIAKEGLGLQGSKKVFICDFDELIQTLISEDDEMMTTTSRPTFWNFSPNGKAVAVKCLLRSYLDDFHGSEEGLRPLMGVLTKCLTLKGIGTSLEEACSEALSVCIGSSAIARSMIQSSSLPLELSDLRDMIITSNSAKSKRFLADVFGNFLMDTPLLGPQWIDVVTDALSYSSTMLAVEPLKPSNGVHGAALLGGTCVRLVRQNSTLIRPSSFHMASTILERFGSALTNVDDMVGNIFCDALFLSCSGGDKLKPELHESLKACLNSVLKNQASALNRFGDGDRVNAPRILKLIEPSGLSISIAAGLSECSNCVAALFKVLGSDAFRKDEEIGLAVGEALATFAEADCNLLQKIGARDWPLGMDDFFARNSPPAVQVVFTLLRTAKSTSNNHKRRACGPALLAVVARATSLDVNKNLRICLQSYLAEVQGCFLFLLVDSKSSQMSRESCCLGLAACHKLVVASESDELKARLLKSFGTTNHGGSAMQETREQAEQRRRADGENTTNFETSNGVDVGGAAGVSEASLGAYREMASAAVACGRPDILYSMLIMSVSHSIWFSTEKRRDSYGSSALGENFNNEEVKIALRPFLGQLLPRILRACNDPNKQTREQMETLWIGLTGGGEEGREAISDNLRPTMDALVEETSSKYWRARVGACGALSQICVGRSWKDIGGGGPILDENYDLVMSKTASESTPGGIRLLRLWRAVIRSLDDVRITVRESGEALGRSVRSLTIYLCNPHVDSDSGSTRNIAERERDAVSASATVLRWLLRNGLKQQCPEAAGICISALIGIIDIAKPAILEALLSDVIYALLMAMSNLEPAAFSYLAVREEEGSDAYQHLSRLRIQASQNSPLATALRNCVDLVPKSSSLRYQEAIVPAIESAIRKSSGMATRTAAAECVITLCTTCPNMFQSSTSTSSSSLLRCFFEAVYHERGGRAAQDKMNGAFGALSSLCPGTAIRSLASSATERYKEAHGNNDDGAIRQASAMVLRSIAVKASKQFADPGNSDVWCRKVLPISFLGMRDPEKRVASLWQETWEDGGAAVDLGSSKNDTGNTLEEKLLLNLTKECVKALDDRSWSRRVTGAVALASLADKEILAPPPCRLSQNKDRVRKRCDASRLALSSLVRLVARSRIWSGKDEVVRALVQISKVWMSFAVNEEANALFGNPNLSPIIFDSASDKDLFLNDAFFEEGKENNDMVEGSDQDDSIPGKMLSINDMTVVPIPGICRLLLMKSFPVKSALRSIADEEILPYRSNVLQSMELLLKSLPDSDNGSHYRRRIFTAIAPKLWEVFRHRTTDESSGNISKESPLIVARSIDCFASSCWKYMQFQHIEEQTFFFVRASELSQTYKFHVDLTKQSAWTVREAAAKGASKLAKCADFETLKRRQTVSTLVDIAEIALKDRRFWKVRLGGLDILKSVVLRVDNVSQTNVGKDPLEAAQEKQLVLEVFLPHKEKILNLAKRSLNDSEAKVTAISTTILAVISTWP